VVNGAAAWILLHVTWLSYVHSRLIQSVDVGCSRGKVAVLDARTYRPLQHKQ